MIVISFALIVFIIVFGIPGMIIDFKHRKNNAYEPGNAWGYYAKLAKEGSREGKFMMLQTYAGITFIIAVLAYLAFRLFMH